MVPPSAIKPVGQAVDRTRRVLFQPFQLSLWLKLGLCAWLVLLLKGGGGGGQFQFPAPGLPPAPGPGPAPGPPPTGGAWIDWLVANALYIGMAAFGLVLLFLLAGWLAARGQFMFVDGIARARGAVVGPWREFRAEGNRYFVFTVLVAAFAVLSLAVVAALWSLTAFPLVLRAGWTPLAVTLTVLAFVLMLAVTVAWVLVLFLGESFVVTAMYVRRIGVTEAWRVVGAELLRPHAVPVVMFILMRVGIGIVVAILASIAMCVTCLLAALPYVGTVILLPLHVFTRAYTLHFVEQVGPAWRVFVHDDPGVVCASCGYALDGLPERGVCPECGTPYERFSGGGS